MMSTYICNMTRVFNEKKKKRKEIIKASYTAGNGRKQLMINRYSSNRQMLNVGFFVLLLVFPHFANTLYAKVFNFYIQLMRERLYIVP